MVDNTEKDKVLLVAEHIRDMSAEGKLTRYEDFYSEPLSLTEEEVGTLKDRFKDSEDYSDITAIQGSSGTYLYSTNKMTLNYAKLMVRIEDKDLLKTIAETVREESKIYPRPTDAQLFLNSPFNFTDKELIDVLKQIKTKPEYSDIKETRASNDALYIYSDKYLEDGYASYLAEWIEVGQPQNP